MDWYIKTVKILMDWYITQIKEGRNIDRHQYRTGRLQPPAGLH
jgi:hypothetical protein